MILLYISLRKKNRSRSNQVDQIWDKFRAGYAPVQSWDFCVRSMSFWQPIGMGRIKKTEINCEVRRADAIEKAEIIEYPGAQVTDKTTGWLWPLKKQLQ